MVNGGNTYLKLNLELAASVFCLINVSTYKSQLQLGIEQKELQPRLGQNSLFYYLFI